MKDQKPKKIINGGIYWIDFKEFRLPEWGNSPSGKPHLSVLIKINDFLKKEMYLSFPITSQGGFIKSYGNKIIIPLHSINKNSKNKKHFVLLNQVRTISKGRVLKPFILDDEEIILKNKAIKELNRKYVNFINYNMDTNKINNTKG